MVLSPFMTRAVLLFSLQCVQSDIPDLLDMGQHCTVNKRQISKQIQLYLNTDGDSTMKKPWKELDAGNYQHRSFNWQVALVGFVPTLGTYEYFCSGALIFTNLIITAAHCLYAEQKMEVDGKMVNKLLPINALKVKVLIGFDSFNISRHSGGFDVTNANDFSVDGTKNARISLQKVFGVEKWTVNRDYLNGASNFEKKPLSDLALIKLAQPVVFNQYISPVCLYGGPDESIFSGEDPCRGYVCSGFGPTSDEISCDIKHNEVLMLESCQNRKVSEFLAKPFPNAQCKEYMSWMYDQNVFCTEGIGQEYYENADPEPSILDKAKRFLLPGCRKTRSFPGPEKNVPPDDTLSPKRTLYTIESWSGSPLVTTVQGKWFLAAVFIGAVRDLVNKAEAGVHRLQLLNVQLTNIDITKWILRVWRQWMPPPE